MESGYWNEQWSKNIRKFNTFEELISANSEVAKEVYLDLNELLSHQNYQNKKILDIGGGYGYLLELMFDKSNSKFLFDTSETAINVAKEFYDFHEAKVMNILTDDLTEYTNSFDVIVCFEVLEHIHPADTNKFLQKIKNLLKKDGEFYMTTPNITSLPSRLKLMLGMLPNFYTMEFSHIAPFRPQDLRSHLEKSGFKVEELATTHAMFPIKRGRYVKLPFRMNLGENIIAKCTKG